MNDMLLSQRALSRATLERQLLLRRHHLPAARAIERLAGMQAQAPNAPYVGLWSRLEGFRPDELSRLMTGRQVARMRLMRGTVHLATGPDCLAFWPLVLPAYGRELTRHPEHRLPGVDREELAATARALVAERPRTQTELGRLLGERWPGHAPDALARGAGYHLPLVQVPPRGVWGAHGPAAYAGAATWLGRDLDPAPGLEGLVLRYLAAFGPATVMDAQTWSGLTRLGEVFERLAPRLRTFRDEAGALLHDLPEAPRPDAATPAPPRFLPEYDNVLLSHADRRRVIPDGRPVPLPPGNGGATGTLLVDGFFRGTWTVERERGTARLRVRPFDPLPASDRAAVAEEGGRLLGLAAADEDHDVVVG